MLFDRRHPPKFLEKFRILLWPRTSWTRSARYFSKRVLRLSGSPHVIAIGFACGAASSCTPFVGFHFLVGFLLAYIARGNMLASALGTSIGNPLTFPFIWASTYKLGHFLLNSDKVPGDVTELSFKGHFWEKSFDSLWPLLKPMLVGSIPIGLSMAVVSYFVVFYTVKSYQDRRRLRIARKKNKLSRSARQDN